MAWPFPFHLALHGMWRLAGRPSPWPRRFLAHLTRAAGVETATDGQPLAGSGLIVCNHLSWLDILIVCGATGARFVAKDEVSGWPVIGWLAGLHDTVFVARTDRGRVHHQADRLRAALTESVPIVLFPEGGTGNGHAVGPFRASLFAALTPPQPGVMLQPLAIDYGAEASLVAWPADDGVGVEAMRILSLPGKRRVALHFLPPIDPAALPDRKALAAAARDAIRQALGEGHTLPV